MERIKENAKHSLAQCLVHSTCSINISYDCFYVFVVIIKVVKVIFPVLHTVPGS